MLMIAEKINLNWCSFLIYLYLISMVILNFLLNLFLVFLRISSSLLYFCNFLFTFWIYHLIINFFDCFVSCNCLFINSNININILSLIRFKNLLNNCRFLLSRLLLYRHNRIWYITILILIIHKFYRPYLINYFFLICIKQLVCDE